MRENRVVDIVTLLLVFLLANMKTKNVYKCEFRVACNNENGEQFANDCGWMRTHQRRQLTSTRFKQQQQKQHIITCYNTHTQI